MIRTPPGFAVAAAPVGRTDVKVLSRKFAAIGFVVCLVAAMGACGTRSTTVAVPDSPESAAPPTEEEPRPPAAPPPDPPPSDPPARPLPAPDPPLATTTALDCSVLADPGEPIASVAVSDPVDPSNAPRPSNDSERLVFRQVYETLIAVDCGGQARPALAASWRLAADGRAWIFTLRENARFTDGTPVTPDDVRASWSEGNGDALRPDVGRLVAAVASVDDRSLAVTLRNHRTDVPLPLAHTDLAIARRTPGSVWPLGTRGDGTVAELAVGASSPVVVTLKRQDFSTIRVVPAAGDPRDALDQAIDLMITRDPAALDYAATLPQFRSVPLEWQHVHVLLTPARPQLAPSLADEPRQVLADDAVRGEARGAGGPFWWKMLDGCVLAGVQPLARPRATPRIVYDARDGVARDLAERLVGLARGAGPSPILDVLLAERPRRSYERSIGLTGELLARALRLGTDAGYMVSLNRRSLDPCRDTQALMDRAPWLDPETVIPLVETRPRAIVRRGKAGLAADWDGGVRLERAAGAK